MTYGSVGWLSCTHAACCDGEVDVGADEGADEDAGASYVIENSGRPPPFAAPTCTLQGDGRQISLALVVAVIRRRPPFVSVKGSVGMFTRRAPVPSLPVSVIRSIVCAVSRSRDAPRFRSTSTYTLTFKTPLPLTVVVG